MKKSLLNIGLTIALTGTAISGSVLSTQAYAGENPNIETTDMNTANIDNSEGPSSDNYMFPGMGAGAAAGTLVAGPIGFVVGGLIGGFVGSSQEPDDSSIQTNMAISENSSDDFQLSQSQPLRANESLSEEQASLPSVQVAQLGDITIPESSSDIAQDEIINILTGNLSLDIYFRSGSTRIETFYPARLGAVAKLMNNMTQLEIQLDGYTDRRGNKNQNIKLANQRIENVKQQLISAGVEENRIISKAYGEMKMVSIPGDLEAYTFDRKVVIRFVRSDTDSIHNMASTLSEMDGERLNSAISDEAKTSTVAEASTAF